MLLVFNLLGFSFQAKIPSEAKPSVVMDQWLHNQRTERKDTSKHQKNINEYTLCFYGVYKQGRFHEIGGFFTGVLFLRICRGCWYEVFAGAKSHTGPRRIHWILGEVERGFVDAKNR